MRKGQGGKSIERERETDRDNERQAKLRQIVRRRGKDRDRYAEPEGKRETDLQSQRERKRQIYRHTEPEGKRETDIHTEAEVETLYCLILEISNTFFSSKIDYMVDLALTLLKNILLG
jgi:hypothetical protein